MASKRPQRESEEESTKAAGIDADLLGNLFNDLTSGIVYGKIVTNDEGKPIDLVYLGMNDAYERLMGVSKQDIGKRVTEIFPNYREDKSDWIGPYARAALNGERSSFERLWPVSKRWYKVSVLSPKKGYFAATAEDIDERKKAEESVKESEERYRGLYALMNEGLQICELMFDENGKPNDVLILSVNPSYERQTGIKREQVEGRRISEILSTIEQAWFERYEKVVRNQESITFEEYNASLDKWFEVHASPLPERNHFAAIFNNITERKKAEQVLEESEASLIRAQRIAHLGSWEWDLATNEVTGSEELYRMFGLSPNPKTFFQQYTDLLVPEDRQRVIDALDNTIKNNAPYNIDYHLVLRDGTDRYIHAEAVTAYENGKPVKVFGTAQDITERRRAEEALWKSAIIARERAEEIEAIMDAVPATIWVARDPQCVSMVGNKATEEMLRVQENANVSKSAPENERPENFQPYRDGKLIAPPDLPMQTAARTGKPVERTEFELRFNDGHSVSLYGNAVPLRDEDGRVRGAVGAFLDITERKKVEEALAKSRRLLERVVSDMNEGVVILDPSGNIVDFNEAFAHILRFKNKEEVLRSIDKFAELFKTYRLDGSPLPVNEWAASRALAGETGAIENIAERTDTGERFILFSSYAPLKDDDEQIIGGIQVSTDITERIDAAEALRESEERFRTLADNIPTLCWMANADGWIFWYNKRWYEYTGTTPKEMEGWGWQSVHDPEMLPKVLERWKDSIASGEPFEMVFPLRGADGVFRPFLTRIKPVKDSEGKVVRWFGSNTDITAEIESKRHVEEERARLQAVLDAAPIGIFVGDASGATVLMNKAFDDIWKGPAPRPGGVSEYAEYKAWFADSGKEVRAEDWPTARALKGEASSAVANIQRFDGSRGSILALAVPMRNDGKVTGVIGIVQDITELKKTEEALRRSNKELQHFAYISSHDLQEPLRMVTSYLGLLERRHGNELSPEAKEYMGFAAEGAMRMKDLINDLLSYTRVESRGKPFAQVDMNRVFEEVKNNLSASIEANHATLTASGLPTIKADDTQMVQLLQNLISNAIKFNGGQEPDVKVSCKESWREYTFSVQDNGIGIPSQYQEKIFEMFQRLHTRDEYEGTGIGLAVAKKIVERHGGRIWVESDGKHGSTFCFTIRR